MSAGRAELSRRWAATFVWAAGVWMVLTWTVTFEQLVVGGLVAAAVAGALAPLGAVARPWRLLEPRVLGAAIRLLLVSLVRIARANAELARRIWTPSLPLRSGMVIVRTGLHSDGGVGGTGLITSLIVDNQIVDLDRTFGLLQYHAIEVPHGDMDDRVAEINGPVEDRLAPLTEPDS